MESDFQVFLNTLKAKLNIVEIASNYVTTERRGNNYWACCPFHHEKTPSFAINGNDQYYHCFGCGESGDVIKFVKEMENVEFIDAVKILADKAGLEMPKSGFDNKKTEENKRKRDQILKIMNDCAHFYLGNLASGKAEPHIEYILKRKIPSEIVRTFGLGASLNFYDLPKYLLAKGYSKSDMIDSGAVSETEGKLIDAQGGRLIFPVINALGEVIAFGGRVLKKTDFGKYKNTKETLVFNKSKNLYNINLLKKLRKTQTIKEVIIVEGYMDTLSLYGSGFKNVVASMGTSLTQDQARLIKRYTDNVLISYDGDGAGQKANLRGLEILKSEGLNVRVVPLPDGLDPDDVIKQRGNEGYRQCLNSAMPLIDYKLGVLEKNYDLSDTFEKRSFVSEAVKILRTADSAAEQEELLKKLREKTGISYEALKRDLNSSPPQSEQRQTPPKKDVSDVNLKASRFVIAAYLFGAKYANGDITAIPFCSDVHTVIASYIKSKKIMQERIQPSELFEFFEENSPEYRELCNILDYSDGDSLSGAFSDKYFNDCVLRLKLNRIDGEINALSKIISSGDGNIKDFAVKLQELIKLKEKLKSGENL